MRLALRSPFVFCLAVGCLPAISAQVPQYVGVTSCSSQTCHGSVQPIPNSKVLQNEYSTWLVRDKHTRAYANLSNDVGRRIIKIMNLDDKGVAERCYPCHSVQVPSDRLARTFDRQSGVTCENCHGPASQWLEPHDKPGWNYDRVVKELGLYPTRDLVRRTSKCLECHVGTSNAEVDHELIAAGHPDLFFELGSFMAVMPSHWNEADKDPWFAVRAVAVGQAVGLREQLKRIAREAQKGPWPEYAELDCFACHHGIYTPESWRQDSGYRDRRPGNAQWNLSRYVVLARVIQETEPGTAQLLTTEIGRLYSMITALQSDRNLIAAQATSTAEIADRLTGVLNGMTFDQAMALRLMKSIAADSMSVAQDGERSAEEATMVLDSLFVAYSNNAPAGADPRIKAGIKNLYTQLDPPSLYNAVTFSASLNSLQSLLQ